VANQHCNNWTDASAGASGQFGLTDQVGAAWLNSADRTCSNTGRLYCMSRYADYARLNQSFTPSFVSLSSNDTQVNFASAASSRLVRGDSGKLSGKYYFEVEVIDNQATSYFAVGLVDSVVQNGSHLLDAGPGFRVGCIGASGAASCEMNNSASVFGPSFDTIGDRIKVAVDFDSTADVLIWFGEAGGPWVDTGGPCPGNPGAASCASFIHSGTPVGGLFPAASISNITGGEPRLKFHFKSAEWSEPAPAGFNPWSD
jgi:hypothetical protein